MAHFRRNAVPHQEGDAEKQHLCEVPQPIRDEPIRFVDLVGHDEVAAIKQAGAIQFHATGDTGVGLNSNQPQVSEAMAGEINVARPELGPVFLLHLGDLIYGTNKASLYANNFYRPNLPYLKPAPGFDGIILAIPGNHDGEVRDPADDPSLSAFQEHFVQPVGCQPPIAKTFGVRMPNQPGVYWLLDAPFLNIIGLYSNTGEDFGLLGAHPDDAQQTDWLTETLHRIQESRRTERKALIFAMHHHPYGRGLQQEGSGHPGNPELQAQLDEACAEAGIWPDAVLSGHTHTYQRYLRRCVAADREFDITYFVAGTGGIRAVPAPEGVGAEKTENPVPPGLKQSVVTYQNGDANFGFLRVAASATQLRVTFVRTLGCERQEFEVVTMDLATQRQLAPSASVASKFCA